jgi:hypothetical protein
VPVWLSPFLELGAERGQRSLVVANDFSATGIAADISCHQLLMVDHFSHLFQRERLPTRVCCDPNHLPFGSDAFSFVFGYQFLHDCPSLPQIISEINRLLGDGAEPFKRMARLPLYQQEHKAYSQGLLPRTELEQLYPDLASSRGRR